MTKIAIFPGTFDPVTFGHQELIQRAAKVFDQVIVAVAENVAKTPLFNFEQRINMTKNSMQSCKNVTVKGFSNLLVDFARENNARIIIRGVRVSNDFEYELQLANMNRHLDADIETMFLTPSDKYSYISSTLVKEIAKLKGDVTSFVNPEVMKALQGASWR